MNNPKIVSVIITTKNEETNIRKCLDSVKRQNFQERYIEIIVVDNNSIDLTKEIARSYTDKVYNYGPERSAQRNFGVKQASGEYILYLDADMSLSENVIGECVEMCESGKRIALYIPERIIGRGFWARTRDFERSFYNATAIDCVRFVRRDKFLEISGFDEALTGPEDWDFDRRIRKMGEVGIVKSPLYHHEGNIDFKKYLAKKSYYSNSFNNYIMKWGSNDLIIRKQLGGKYRIFTVFIEDGKWKRLLVHPVLAFKMFILRLMIGIKYYISRKAAQPYLN
jgi:glycosyltransferase involved in cell wall biosynthesis